MSKTDSKIYSEKVHFQEGADEELVSCLDHRGELVPCRRDADGLLKPVETVAVSLRQGSRL